MEPVLSLSNGVEMTRNFSRNDKGRMTAIILHFKFSILNCSFYSLSDIPLLNRILVHCGVGNDLSGRSLGEDRG